LKTRQYERLVDDYKEDDRVELNIFNYKRQIKENRDALDDSEKTLNALRDADFKIETIKVLEKQITDLKRDIAFNLENDHLGSARSNINTYIRAVAKYKETSTAYLDMLKGLEGVDTSENRDHFYENIRIFEKNIILYNANVPK